MTEELSSCMATPDKKIHQKIAYMLHGTGWCVQMFSEVDQGPTFGLAVRDFPLARGYGSIDYLLYIDGKAVGLIEVKNEREQLCGIPVRYEKYSRGLPFSLRLYTRPLPFLYQSNGTETCFTNSFDPEPKPRRLHGFHKPETLQSWLADGMVGETPRDMAAAYFPEHRRRGRTFHERVLINMPDLVTTGFSSVEIKAVQALETALKLNRRRTLIKMAVGSERRTAMRLFVDRLLRFVDARRVLILLDQEKDIDGLMSAFQKENPEENSIDLKARLCVATIEKLDRLLKTRAAGSLPIETFEVIVLDECPASVLTKYRRILEYFDAYMIGISERPDKEIRDFFNEAVSDIDQQEDGLNVISGIP